MHALLCASPALQPWLNRLFSHGLRKAGALRSARLNIARDGLVRLLPLPLLCPGAACVLLRRASCAWCRPPAAADVGALQQPEAETPPALAPLPRR